MLISHHDISLYLVHKVYILLYVSWFRHCLFVHVPVSSCVMSSLSGERRKMKNKYFLFNARSHSSPHHSAAPASACECLPCDWGLVFILFQIFQIIGWSWPCNPHGGSSSLSRFYNLENCDLSLLMRVPGPGLGQGQWKDLRYKQKILWKVESGLDHLLVCNQDVIHFLFIS